MDFLRRNSSLGPILPIIAPFTSSPGSQSPARQDSGLATGAAGTSTSGGHQRKWSSLFRSLERIDIERANQQRRQDSGLIMSPFSDGTVCVEPEDGTFDEVIGRRIVEKQGTDSTMVNDTAQTEEKPGNGNVWDIWTVMPKNVRRWNKPASLPVSHVKIPAGSLGMSRPAQPMPEGWTMHIHPEGKPYFHRVAMEPPQGLLNGTLLYDKGKLLSQPLEIVTDSDPRDPMTRKTLEHAHFITRITIAENNLELPERTELFLELYPEQEEDLHPYAGYYLVDHNNQTVFWATEVETRDVGAFKVNPETYSDQHLKLQMTHQYWSHIECYPLDKNIDISKAQESLLEQVTFLYMDVATSHSSTSSWTESQCQLYLSILSHTPKSRKTWAIARLMAQVANWQFQNLYGHPSARLSRFYSYEVEVAGPPTHAKGEKEESGSARGSRNGGDGDAGSVSDASSTKAGSKLATLRSFYSKWLTFYHATLAFLLRVVCVLLFDAPAAHNVALEKVWVDKIVNKARFQYLIDRTTKDWGDVSLLSTVLWTANMAFLAIPYPINPQEVPTSSATLRVVMTTCSLASTVFSVGSIAIGLLHVRKHRVERTAEEYCEFLMTEHHHLYGHRPLAILWSLPFAFLMWSVLTFSAAVMLFCFTSGGIATKSSLIALSALIVASIVVSVWYFWQRETKWTISVEGHERLSFRMKFNDWFWDMMPSQIHKPAFL